MKQTIFLMSLVLLFSMTFTQAVAQQDIESLLNAVENEMSQLRQNNYDLLSPENFSNAQEEYNKAKKEFEEGKDIRGIKERLEKASRYLKVVNDVGKQGEILFKDVLQAREDALLGQAPEYASKKFEEAEKIKNIDPDAVVILETNAPICSKSVKFLNENGIIIEE